MWPSSTVSSNRKSLIILHTFLSALLIGPTLTSAGNGRIMEIILEEAPPPLLPPSIGQSTSAATSMNIPPIFQQFPVPQRSVPEFEESPAAALPSGQCNIQVQVFKMVPGRCMRLGLSGSHGCVSGNHIAPFHRDCM